MDSDSLAIRSLEDSALEALKQEKRFSVVRLLGTGAMGTVHLAQDTKLQRQVAIKTVRSQLAQNDAFRRRIERECLLHAKVGPHPHIVTLFDKVEAGDQIHLVMEFVDGETLQAILERFAEVGARMPAAEALSVSAQILDALSRIHAQGIVHRDIKPSNVMVTRNDAGDVCAKLMDFGVARLVEEDEELSRLTATDSGGPGTPLYMAPEQIDTHTFGTVTAATDVYAMGILLYQLFCGRPPFKGTLTEVLRAHIVVAPPAIETFYHGPVPAGLPEIVGKALSKKPADRYPTAKAFRAELNRVLADCIGHPLTSSALSTANALEQTARVVRPTDLGKSAGQSSLNATTAIRLYIRRKRNMIALAAGVLVFLALFAGSVLYVSSLLRDSGTGSDTVAAGEQILPEVPAGVPSELAVPSETPAVEPAASSTDTSEPEVAPDWYASLASMNWNDDESNSIAAPEFMATDGLPNSTLEPNSAAAALDSALAQTPHAGEEHVVEPGDSLSKIATKYEVDVQDLQWWNNVLNPNTLSVGQVLVLYPKADLPPRDEFLAKAAAATPKTTPDSGQTTPPQDTASTADQNPLAPLAPAPKAEEQPKEKKGLFKRIFKRE